jgi:hypothetical protein
MTAAGGLRFFSGHLLVRHERRAVYSFSSARNLFTAAAIGRTTPVGLLFFLHANPDLLMFRRSSGVAQTVPVRSAEWTDSFLSELG